MTEDAADEGTITTKWARYVPEESCRSEHIDPVHRDEVKEYCAL